MIPPKTQREIQSFFNSSENPNGDDGWLWEISALGKSEVSKLSMKILRQKQNIDSDFRESKTPRDMIPKLNAWDIIKEKNINTLHDNIIEGEENHNESSIRPSFDKEKYMKNNWINNRTKLQLDQFQNNESNIDFY